MNDHDCPFDWTVWFSSKSGSMIISVWLEPTLLGNYSSYYITLLKNFTFELQIQIRWLSLCSSIQHFQVCHSNFRN